MMRPNFMCTCMSVCVSAWLAMAAAAWAADEPGSADHPLVGRYAGSSIVFYKTSDFDEAALLQAPHDYAALLDRDAVDDRSGEDWLKLEGRVSKIRYEIPAGRSSLEVMRNYENALKGKGFAILFNCADRTCFSGKLQDPYLLGLQVDRDNMDSTLYFDHVRYVLAKLDMPDGSIYSAVLTGEDQQRVTAFVTVVEANAMKGDMIAFVDARSMEQAIAQSGKINIYGILFDYDKDTLRPESKPTLDEIAKLLREKAKLRLDIIGHTDNRGTPDYNINLSRRRAASVVAALVRDYGISADRLASSGAGLTSPVAPNDTDEGRAKNRRVELIAR
jgi:OmpA-OmpF porin, OOP family